MSPKVAICPEKQSLADACLEVAQDVIELEDRIMGARVDDEDLQRLDLAMKRARQKVEVAKQRFLLHIRAHGC